MYHFLCNVMHCLKIAVTELCLEFVGYSALQKPTKNVYSHTSDGFSLSKLKACERKWHFKDFMVSEFPGIHNSLCVTCH